MGSWTPTAPRSERKKHETRIALSWAAIRLTVERGYDNVRIEDIAAEAGVSTRTFSNYFGSKGEAIVGPPPRPGSRDRRGAAEAPGRRADLGRPSPRRRWPGSPSASPVPEGRPPDQAWLEGIRLMVAEPALQGEFHKAGAAGEAEIALVVAERTGTDVGHGRLPAARRGCRRRRAQRRDAAVAQAEPPQSMEDLLRDVFGRLAAGLPEPR